MRSLFCGMRCDCPSSRCRLATNGRVQRLEKQVANAQDKLERAQRHAEDKRTTNARTLERLNAEYEHMSEERRDNDRVVKDLTAETEEVERKVRRRAWLVVVEY